VASPPPIGFASSPASKILILSVHADEKYVLDTMTVAGVAGYVMKTDGGTAHGGARGQRREVLREAMYANGTILGYRERTGNPPLEGLVMDYVSLKGDTNGMDLSVITEIAEYFEREIGCRIPPNYPFVGRDFNVRVRGFTPLDLQHLRHGENSRGPPRVAVDKTSGASGISTPTAPRNAPLPAGVLAVCHERRGVVGAASRMRSNRRVADLTTCFRGGSPT
jgi:hypothetical protein